MNAGSLFIAGSNNKNSTLEVRGQNPSASDKEDSGADTFGTVLEQVGTKAKETPRSSAPAESDEPTKPDPATKEDPAELVQVSLQAGQLSQLTIMVQPADVPTPQGSDSQPGDTQDVANGQSVPLAQPTLFSEQASQSDPSGKSQPAASVPDVNVLDQVLTPALKPTAPTDQPQVAGSTGQAQAAVLPGQTLLEQDQDPLQPTQSTGLATNAVSSQIRNGTAPGDSALDGLRPGDQSGLSKSETIGQSEPGANSAMSHEPSALSPQAFAKAEEPDKAAVPDDRAMGKDEAQKSGAQKGLESVNRPEAGDGNRTGSAWSEGKGKESSKEGKGAGLQQATSGAERFLTNGAQAQVSGAKPVPAPQPSSQVAVFPSEPTMPRIISSIQVEVHPPDLGQVQVRVALADQTVHANVTTQQTEVREFLVANQAKLEAGFHAAGLDLGEFKVTVDQQGRGSYGQPDSGWSREPGWNAPGQGRADQEETSQPGYQSGYPAGMQGAAGAREGRVLSLFA